MAVPTADAVDAATGAGAAGASGAAATISVIVLIVFAAVVVVFVVHGLVVGVELAAVVDQEERRLTRGHHWRGRRWFQLSVGDQILLQLQQLAHEVEVRRDDGAGQFHHLVRFQQGHGLVPHDVGYGNGGTAADAGLTVEQHGGTFFPGVLNEFEGLLEVLLDVLVRGVAGRDLLVFQARFQQTGCGLLAGDVQYAVGSDGGRVYGVPAVAKQEMWKHGRCGMRFDVIGNGRAGTAACQRDPGPGRDR